VDSPNATAFDAARALKSHHVGAIMVEDHGRLIGIVTDRDLATRAMGGNLEPKRTELRDIMTPNPFTLPLEASEREAVTLMRARHIRRIPILDEERVVGIVTLDDLLMSGAVNCENAGAIVEGQLAEPADSKPAGELYPMHPLPEVNMAASPRHAAHARQTLAGFKSRLARSLGVNDEDTAFAAFELVVSTLARRLLPSEAKDLAAQLPWAL
jgi:hypothetical protein